MKILHINQSDLTGGAAIAGYRLHQGLLSEGIHSRLLVGTKTTNSQEVTTVKHYYPLENFLFRFTKEIGLNYINLIGCLEIKNSIFYKEADILNFHNLHTGYFNYLAIPQITKNKPAIYTLHDMWSFTGHCIYSFDCNKWESGCGKCPYPETYPWIKRDNTALEWKLKNWVYNQSNLTIVTPSKWLTEQVRKSMLNKFNIYYIPYGIDTLLYQPLGKQKCRDLLGIDKERKVIMFGADSLEDSRKGADLLLLALQKLPHSLKKQIILLTIGKNSRNFAKSLDLLHIDLGFISNDRLKSIAYSAADLFLLPTRADNLPLVILESMACGTPAISFNIGGLPDLVRQSIAGYLAQPENTDDFLQGIMEILEDSDLLEKMSSNCRKIILDEFTLELQIQRYIGLYQQILQKN